ncbi:hypothetical protein CDD83_9848 [Cordyceps sp. RAO-2017]|nr:hypothetical protein CDD83_9848 [Cordyceps sp. RAO-2017]
MTAQALGRSPYDDVVEGEGQEDTRQPTQQYDYRGRPINPETRRMIREIVRSHNEVMLVIGVAEAENMGLESEYQRRHHTYEEAIGLRLASPAKRCVEAVGNFGVNGLRQRILIYRRYSQIPFWELFQAARREFSPTRDILAGAPASFLATYIELRVRRRQSAEKGSLIFRRCLHHVWSYVRPHLELYVALQRLGLTTNKLLLPNPKFFIPFTSESPIPAPPPPPDFSPGSLLRWVGSAFVSATPFLVWVMAQRILRDWKPQAWSQIFKRLPNTIFQGRQQAPVAPPSNLPPPRSQPTALPELPNESSEGGNPLQVSSGDEAAQETGAPGPQDQDPTAAGRTGEVARRASLFSARGDDYASDEDENEGVSATLISFDVEATESADAPPGLWSAELRPSVAPDSRANASQQPVFLDTLLTQLPALIGSHIFTDAVTRLLTTPSEATALRLIARSLRLRQGLSCQDMYPVGILSGFSWNLAVNFLATELLHLVLCGEVWAAFTALSQWLHRTEEEWSEYEDKLRASYG